MRKFDRSIWVVILLGVTILLSAACSSSSDANTAGQVQHKENGDSEQEHSDETSPEDASDHTDGEADADHDGDPMTVAMAHDIPEEAAAAPNPIAYDEDSVAIGAELFSQSCSVCHGPEGKGDGPGAAGLDPKPASLIADHVQANTDGALFYTISNGRPDTAMVSWSATYSETDRWHLVNFIRSLATE